MKIKAEAAPIPADARIERGPRVVPLPLTEEALQKTAHELAEKLRDIEIVRAELKEEAGGYRDRIKSIQAEVNVLREAILTGDRQEERDCEVVYDYAANRVIVRLAETGRVVEERAMSDEERQRELYPQDERG